MGCEWLAVLIGCDFVRCHIPLSVCRIKPGDDTTLWVHTHGLILACSSTRLRGVLILPLLSNEIYWPYQEQWGATLVQDNIIYWEEETRDCLRCPHNIWKTCNCCLPDQQRDKRGQILPAMNTSLSPHWNHVGWVNWNWKNNNVNNIGNKDILTKNLFKYVYDT